MNVGSIRNARSSFSIHPGRFYFGKNFLFDLVAHRGHVSELAAPQGFHSQLRRLAKTDDSGDVLRTRASRSLMTSPIKHWFEHGALTHVECAHSLRRMHFVSRNRKQIASQTIHIDRHFSRRLYGVAVKIHIRFGGDLANLLDWLQHAGLVVCHHDRDEPRLRTQSVADVFWIDQPSPIYANVSDFTSDRLEVFARVQHRMMFNGRTDHVVPGTHSPQNSEVVGLSAAAGKNNLRGPAPEQRRY